MGATRIPRIARRTVNIDVGTLVCIVTGFVLLLFFDGRPLVRVQIPPAPGPPTPPVSAPAPAPKLQIPTALTLHFRSPWDRVYVLHNCVQARRASARMLVVTENLDETYCRVCECELFRPIGCLPPNRTAGAVNHCEKLNFMARTVPAHGELIYLDSDVVVMTPTFFSRLAVRSKAANFLATYGHDEYRAPRHYGYFNSGVLFIRAVENANFSELMPRMYKHATGYDQSILTNWVYDYYGTEWDTLSWKWHCRNLGLLRIDTPPDECITIHDRKEAPDILARLKYSLLNTNS